MRALLVMAVLVGSLGVAQAGGGKVDWSQYLETPAERAASAKANQVPAQPVASSQPAASNAKAKKQPAKPRADAKPKTKRPPPRSARHK